MKGSGKIAYILLFLTVYTKNISVASEIIPDKTLGGESSKVIIDGKKSKNKIINGGAKRGRNLFHSFKEFNIRRRQKVYFSNPEGIKNIIARVTGRNISKIYGVLGVDGNADLFLLNPYGFIFGNGTKLDLNGSFLATTANNINFKNFEYSAIKPKNVPILKINRPIGLDLKSSKGKIVVKGSGHGKFYSAAGESSSPIIEPLKRFDGLRVKEGESISLIASEVRLVGGTVSAPEGTINLLGIRSGDIRFLSANDSLKLGVNDTEYGDVVLKEKALVEANGFGENRIFITGSNIYLEGNSLILSVQGRSRPVNSSISLFAKDSIVIFGNNDFLLRNKVLLTIPNGILSQSLSGKGADINIETDKLELKSFGKIISAAYNLSEGGKIKINTKETIISGIGDLAESNGDIVGTGIVTFSTGISTAGSLGISSEVLNINNGSEVKSVTLGFGLGGDVNIIADNIIVDGIGESQRLQSSISSINTGSGLAGEINISSSTLTLSNGGRISVSNLGTGFAGKLKISAKDLTLSDSEITAFSFKQPGGDINIDSERIKLLNSDIIASGAKKGAGGEIDIKSLTLAGDSRSRIIAESEGSKGGQITITSKGFIFPSNNISASSSINSNLDGIVNLNTISFTPFEKLSTELKTSHSDKPLDCNPLKGKENTIVSIDSNTIPSQRSSPLEDISTDTTQYYLDLKSQERVPVPQETIGFIIQKNGLAQGIGSDDDHDIQIKDCTEIRAFTE